MAALLQGFGAPPQVSWYCLRASAGMVAREPDIGAFAGGSELKWGAGGVGGCEEGGSGGARVS